MEYRILVIDDEEYIHVFINRIIGPEFTIIKAKHAQEAIDILSSEPVDLVISDIHMPGMSGLELLESLKKDTAKRQIPVLIMTNLPSVEKETEAMDLGAADFIDKRKLVQDKEAFMERVRMKLASDVRIATNDETLISRKNKFVSQLLESAMSRDFETAVDTFTSGLADGFRIDFVGLWILDQADSGLGAYYAGEISPKGIDETELNRQAGYEHIMNTGDAYLANTTAVGDLGFYYDFSYRHSLAAEVAVPVPAMTERDLLINRSGEHGDTELFGITVLKRNKLFATDEYELLAALVKQAGSILWRIYSNGNTLRDE